MLNAGKKVGLALLMTIGAGALSVQSHAANLHWSGDVDDRAVIRISGNDVNVRATLQGVRNDHFEFRGGGLPNYPVNVTLREADGRGGVRLVQQPSERNGYTAVVRIVDRAPGRNHYDFDLHWNSHDGGGPRWRRDRG